jgi:hypothetical protein
MFSITIARAIYRDRTVSVPDSLTGGHGDAAFANWVWLATYTFRTKRVHDEHTDSHLHKSSEAPQTTSGA